MTNKKRLNFTKKVDKPFGPFLWAKLRKFCNNLLNIAENNNQYSKLLMIIHEFIILHFKS